MRARIYSYYESDVESTLNAASGRRSDVSHYNTSEHNIYASRRTSLGLDIERAAYLMPRSVYTRV